nr:flagellar basal body-associated protein FliL [Algicola sagamiensis]
MKLLIRSLIALCLAMTIFPCHADKEKKNYAYFGFEPDIITNYINNKPKPGFIRVTAELMLEDLSYLPVVEHHSPLLRDAIVDILSKETEDKVKSLVGREKIRKKCVERVQKLMKEETGTKMIKDILFTKYLYH